MPYRDEFKEVEREAWWTMPRVWGFLAVVVLAIYCLGFLATGGDLAIYRFWAPKQENAKRAVFVETQSYVQGKISTLTLARLQYSQAEAGSAQREALRAYILSEAAQIDEDKLPADLRAFVHSLEGVQ
jgi:hypothetical protein